MRIGLIAGEGKLPVIFSEAARAKGDEVIAFGLEGVTDKALENSVVKMHWLKWGQWQKGILLLVSERIKKAIMLGKIKKEKFFTEHDSLDAEAKKVFDSLGDRKDYAILNEAAKYFAKFGIEVIDSTTYLTDFIPRKGVLTKTQPDSAQLEDINYGKDVARELSRFDIGQTIAVKDKTVVALEAMEGTDQTISRAGSIIKDFVVIKVARPDQDMRFDVPLVGLETIKVLAQSGGRVLAMEEGKTLLLNPEEIVRFADENGISIVII